MKRALLQFHSSGLWLGRLILRLHFQRWDVATLLKGPCWDEPYVWYHQEQTPLAKRLHLHAQPYKVLKLDLAEPGWQRNLTSNTFRKNSTRVRLELGVSRPASARGCASVFRIELPSLHLRRLARSVQWVPLEASWLFVDPLSSRMTAWLVDELSRSLGVGGHGSEPSVRSLQWILASAHNNQRQSVAAGDCISGTPLGVQRLGQSASSCTILDVREQPPLEQQHLQRQAATPGWTRMWCLRGMGAEFLDEGSKGIIALGYKNRLGERVGGSSLLASGGEDEALSSWRPRAVWRGSDRGVHLGFEDARNNDWIAGRGCGLRGPMMVDGQEVVVYNGVLGSTGDWVLLRGHMEAKGWLKTGGVGIMHVGEVGATNKGVEVQCVQEACIWDLEGQRVEVVSALAQSNELTAAHEPRSFEPLLPA
ncbi:hypothetical protein BKA70DRAFT_1397982 [Coprinopsis sp. MPI-PUGE-AT-0042]|nr:hypothetical protein BKA70DRAFT_1397982 [Coprinopsis sp. MPI-PUGE-AT-0042]